MVRTLMFRLYQRAEKLIVPTLRFSQDIYAEKLIASLPEGGRWLDLGCGHQFFPEWMAAERAAVLSSKAAAFGVDLDWESLRGHPDIRNRTLGDLARLPFRAGSFDFVTANMVVEHLEDPAAALGEIHRVLKPKGVFLFHTPNVRHWVIRLAALTPEGVKRKAAAFLHERKEADIFPAHYRMNTPEAVRELAEKNGFRVAELAMVNTSATFVMLGPVALLELLVLRFLETRRGERHRTIIIARLEKR